MSQTLTLKGNLSLHVGEFALQSGDFNIPLHGVTVLFGRSGSGKSTLLRALSGLDKNTRGHLTVGNEVWQAGKKSMPTSQRNLGFVFQDAALFPHMSVRQNLRYALKRIHKHTQPADFDDITQRVGIADKLDRRVTNLSGGEKQRVAIARALLMRPKILCMDEPLSALDWQAKAEMMTLLEDIIARYQLPVLYITHAPIEVERLADRVLFMQQGEVLGVETLQQALARPDSPLFDEQGAVSVLQGKLGQEQAGLCPIQLGANSIWLPNAGNIQKKLVRVRVLAKDVSLALSDPQQLSIINHLPVTVLEIINDKAYRVLVRLQLPDEQELFAEITQFSAERLGLHAGLSCFALIKTVALAE